MITSQEPILAWSEAANLMFKRKLTDDNTNYKRLQEWQSKRCKLWPKDPRNAQTKVFWNLFHIVLKPSTTYKIIKTRKDQAKMRMTYRLLTPGLDNTCLFMSLTAGAGTRCMSLLSSSPNLYSSFKSCFPNYLAF